MKMEGIPMIQGLSRYKSKTNVFDDYIFWNDGVSLLLWLPHSSLWSELYFAWALPLTSISPLGFLILTGVNHRVAPVVWKTLALFSEEESDV